MSKTLYYEHKKAYYNKDAGAWMPCGACDTNPTVVNDFEFSSDEDLQASNVSIQTGLHVMNDFEFSDDEAVQASK